MDTTSWDRAETAFAAAIADGPTAVTRALETLTRIDPDAGNCLRPIVQAYLSQQPQTHSAIGGNRGAGVRNHIGRYQVLACIGRGGMGTVYLAYDPQIRRPVAIKVLHAHHDRFLSEVRAAGTLKHPNIVTVYDCGKLDGQSVIVMEHVEGHTLDGLIRKKRVGESSTRLQLVRQLCAAIGYAHDCGIVHRDIKPANLIVDAHGQLKVLDFGLARIGEPSRATVDVIMGTLRYMSPEQMSGREVDRRSDIFAVGVVAYELLSYRHPFEQTSAVRLAYAIANEQPTPLSKLCPTLDRRLSEIVSKALEKDPAARYTTLSQMMIDLGYVDETPQEKIITPPSRAPAPSFRPVRYALLSPLTWLAIVLPLLAAIAVAAVLFRRPTTISLSSGSTDRTIEGTPQPREELRSRGTRTMSSPPSQLPSTAAKTSWETGARLVGLGDVGSLREGIRLLDQSCYDGETRACRDLAGVYDAGTVVGRNVQAAAALYKRACHNGEVVSCVRLAAMYRGGLGIPANLADAADASLRACDLGAFAECNNAGAAFIRGVAVPKDETRAVSLLSRACENGIAVACVNLARQYLSGNVKQGTRRPFVLLHRACDLGYATACTEAGFLLIDGRNEQKNESRAVALFQRGCDGAAVRGCSNAASMYATGSGVSKDDSRANSLWQRACDGDFADACESLARRYRTGTGAARNPSLAAELSRRANQLRRTSGARLSEPASEGGLLLSEGRRN